MNADHEGHISSQGRARPDHPFRQSLKLRYPRTNEVTPRIIRKLGSGLIFLGGVGVGILLAQAPNALNQPHRVYEINDIDVDALTGSNDPLDIEIRTGLDF